MSFITSFQPNCSLPDYVVPYVASSNVKGTVDILWSSLATIVACTYTVLHLNVPKQRNDRDPGWRGNIKCSPLWENLKWASFALVAPGGILVKAFLDWCNTTRQPQFLRELHPKMKTFFTLTYMLFADMGGFIVEYPGICERSSNGSRLQRAALEHLEVDTSSPDTGSSTPITRGSTHSSHTASADACGQVVQPTQQVNDRRAAPPLSNKVVATKLAYSPSRIEQKESKDCHINRSDVHQKPSAKKSTEFAKSSSAICYHPIALDASTLRGAIEEDYISVHLINLPSKEEILDRSKSDVGAKIVTLVQMFYFSVEVGFRLSRHLAISHLEFGTVAFVVCSAVSYCFTF